MAAKRTTSRKRTASPRRRRTTTSAKQRDQRIVLSLSGILVILLTLLGMFRLGIIGQWVYDLFMIVGGQSYYVLMLVLLVYCLGMSIYGKFPRFKRRLIIGFLLFYLGLVTFMHYLMFNQIDQAQHVFNTTWNNILQATLGGDNTLFVGGGMIGAACYQVTSYLIAPIGSAVLGWILMLVGVVVFFNLPWAKILVGIQNLFHWLKEKRSNRATQPNQASTQPRRTKKQPKVEKPKPENAASLLDKFKDLRPDPAEKDLPTPVSERSKIVEPTINVATSTNSTKPSENIQQSQATDTTVDATDDVHEEVALAGVDGSSVDDDYQLPPANLLTKVQSTDQSADLNSIKANTKKLQETLASFGVDATVENVNLGPTVTKYELRPAIGVKVSKITHLADDLALALAAKDIRIEAPIPGKSLIGIEVPNTKIATVGFRDMIEAAPRNDKPLEVPLGRTVTGTVMMADLTKMPHLLIAGSTGSGKSVAINGIIVSILMKAKPNQVKFLMIDPKKVELSIYNGIPHLLSPVVSEPKKAARALGKVVSEMERRYELFSAFNVRNLDGYNQMVRESGEADQHELPLILVIVDELADLMMTVSNDVETAIVRIAQMGRAAGIHMILATQRPSVDVITGLIKANVPSRIAFAVSSGIDSRTILDANGAEKLLGRGDMLFQPIDQNKPTRVQGAFISDRDVESVVDFIKDESQVEYDDRIVVTDNEMEQAESAEDEDELFQEALAFVVDQQKASTSLIQRRFRIGYNRAARIIDDLEQRGYIGPANGSKPREVYKQPDQE